MKTPSLLCFCGSETFPRCAFALLAALLLSLSPMALTAQSVSYSGTAVNLGSVNVCPAGQTTPKPCSATQTLSFNVTASGTLGAIQVLTQGATGLDFTLGAGSTCTGAVTKGTSCVVNVKFAPGHPGPRLGGVELVSSTGSPLADVPVYGVGLGPLVTFAAEVNVPPNTLAPGPVVAFEPGSQSTLGSGFLIPRYYAVDALGNIFVSDAGNSAVKEILAAGGFLTVKTLGSGFSSPTGIAVDGSGNVFVADQDDNVVKEILATGGYTTVRTIATGFNYPQGVAVDGSGNLFVGDAYNGALKEILAEGGYATVTTILERTQTNAIGPWGVAVDGSGNVFFSDNGNGEIDELLAAGGYTTLKILTPAYDNDFQEPGAVALDAAGNLFVNELGTIYKLLAAGGYTTIEIADSSSGGLATDASGNVYVGSEPYGGQVVKLNYAEPPSVSFPTATQIGFIDTVDGAQTVSVTNAGNEPLLLAAGDNPNYPADFPANTADTSLCAGGTPLVAGGACDVSINFIPSIDGLNTGNVVLTNNSSNLSSAKQSIPVSGTGVNGTTPINFPNGFAGSSSAFSLNGGATVNGNALQLTDGGTFENRSVFFPTRIGVSSFTTEFDFQLSGEADGFTFVVQANGPDAFGTAGGGLGYGPSAAGKAEPAITNSVAVKFDLYNDAGEGNSSTGVYLNGAAPTVPAINLLPSGIDLHSGDVFHAVLRSDGATLTLTITDKTTNASFSQTFPVDIPAVIGGPTGYVGFTAGTGQAASVEKILDWQFTSAGCCTAGEPDFPTGFADATGLTFNGNGGAAIVGGALQLTDGTTFTASSVFDTTAITLPNVIQGTPFTSDFDFQVGSGAGDGFTFVLQSQGLNAIGGEGGGLGYGSDNPNSNGEGGTVIGNSLAVKFDLHNNAGEGSNSTGVYILGESPTVPATNLTLSGINLHSGHIFHARLSTDGVNITVNITDLTEYAVFTKSYPFYLFADYPTVYPGFTAGTGDAANIEKILNWTMTSY